MNVIFTNLNFTKILGTLKFLADVTMLSPKSYMAFSLKQKVGTKNYSESPN